MAIWTVGKEFGETLTVPRGFEEIRTDVFWGKMGELALQKLLKDGFDIEMSLDWTIYRDKNQGDTCDGVLFGRRVDVKTTKLRSRMLLINLTQREAETARGNAPGIYVLCRHGGPLEVPIPVEVVGFFEEERLSGRPWLKRGDMIPGTKTQLQTANWVIPAGELAQNWAVLSRR